MNSTPDDAEQGGKQVIARAAAVLRALEGRDVAQSLGDIAKATGLPRSTVQRIVAMLEAQQLVIAGRAGVRLGPAITRLAASAHVDITAVAGPFIEVAARRTRETVDLCVYRGAHALSVAQRPSDQELRVMCAVGAAFPTYCTAQGKALLALLDDAAVAELLGQRLEARTPYTKTSLPALLADIAQVRETGVGIDRQEHALGVCAIGVTLGTRQGDRYALSIAVPSLRFEEKLDLLTSAILQCKAEIEEAAGL